MTRMISGEIVKAADKLAEGLKKWMIVDRRGEFLVFRLPDTSPDMQVTDAGETMQFWRFDTRHAAERFRNRKIVAEMGPLAEAAAL